MYLGFQFSGNGHGNDYLWLCLRMPRGFGTTIQIKLFDCNRFTLLNFELYIKELKSKRNLLNSSCLRVTLFNKSFKWNQYKEIKDK